MDVISRPSVVALLALASLSPAQTSQPAEPQGIPAAVAQAYPALTRRLAEDEAKIKELTARVKELERLIPPPPTKHASINPSRLDLYVRYHQDFDPRTLAIGQIGVIDWTSAKVSQVIDSSNLLVRIGDRGPLVVWVKGVDTKGMADDQTFKADTSFRVTGTTQYQSTTGSQKTVFVLEPFDFPAVREKIIHGEKLADDEKPQ